MTRPEESYRVWYVTVCDLENLVNEEALAHWGLLRQNRIYKLRCNAPSSTSISNRCRCFWRCRFTTHINMILVKVYIMFFEVFFYLHSAAFQINWHCFHYQFRISPDPLSNVIMFTVPCCLPVRIKSLWPVISGWARWRLLLWNLQTNYCFNLNQPM